MVDNRLGIALNLGRNAVTQYGGFNFNSMAIFNGRPLGASEDGIFSLEDADTDNGALIDSIIELVTTNFGTLAAKRLRKASVGYETSGNLLIKVQVDEIAEKIYTLEPVKTGQKQHRARLNGRRDMKGVYWMWRIENEDGVDFSLDLIDAVTVTLGMGR